MPMQLDGKGAPKYSRIALAALTTFAAQGGYRTVENAIMLNVGTRKTKAWGTKISEHDLRR